MSVSDPLVKELKGFIITLRSKNEHVPDCHPVLRPLCCTLERIFAKGIKTNTSWFGKTQFWKWISKLETTPIQSRITPQLSMAILFVKKNKKTKTDLGRGRLFLRTALVKNVLVPVVKILMENRDVALRYYTEHEHESILGNEILREILLSLLHELKGVDFRLQLKNSSFLDMSWEMPTFKQYELVPSNELGLDIRTVKGFPLVTQIDDGSVAAEDGKVEAGDVLDEMCGDCLRGVGKSGVYYIFNQFEGQPIQLSVIKRLSPTGVSYGPIDQLLQSINLGDLSPGSPGPNSPNSSNSPWIEQEDRPPPEAILPEEMEDEIPVHDSEGKATYTTLYVGKSFLGKDGRVHMIEQGVGEVLQRSKQKRSVVLELGEKDVKVFDKETNQTLIHHLFTEISACGRRTDELKHFAFISGETYCSLADVFYCHVFEAKSEEEAKIILCTIAQGFERTHLMT